jgi:hypothetical protein
MGFIDPAPTHNPLTHPGIRVNILADHRRHSITACQHCTEHMLDEGAVK